MGNELFRNLSSKIDSVDAAARVRLKYVKDQIKKFPDSMSDEEFNRLNKELSKLESDIDLWKRLKAEILNMKRGSIALVGQIRTISKIRIYNPKTNLDTLSKIKLSNEKLDLLDKEIMRNFTNSV